MGRFSTFINNTDGPNVRKILRSKLHHMYPFLQQESVSTDSFISFLTNLFAHNRITFRMPDGKGNLQDNTFVKDIHYYTDGDMSVAVSEDTISYLRSLTEKQFFDLTNNKFVNELTYALKDKMRHRFKYRDVRLEMNPERMKMSEFLGNEDFLDAFAYKSAVDLVEKGETKTMNMYKDYFKQSHPIMRRFNEKYRKYMEELKA